jgi:putative transposase
MGSPISRPVTHQSTWGHSPLQGQLYLGDAEFAEVLGEKMASRLSADAEIPRLQRRALAPPLTRFAAMPERDPAIVQAYATGCYSMKEIAQAFDIHYATVSRIVKNRAEKV